MGAKQMGRALKQMRFYQVGRHNNSLRWGKYAHAPFRKAVLIHHRTPSGLDMDWNTKNIKIC